MIAMMRILILGVVLVLGLLTAACDEGDEVVPAEGSGITGTVLAGPQCPVVMAGSPCPDLPLQATLRIDEVGGGASETVESGSDGQFRLELRPGEYVVTALPDGNGPFPAPPAEQAVTVREGAFTEVTVSYDTGIR